MAHVSEVFNKMRHPYTQALFRSIPLPGAGKNSRALEVFKIGRNDDERRQHMLELLNLVKLSRAFAGDAKIVVADEHVSALDVSEQAAVTNFLMEIQRRKRTTQLFISHDLSIVRYLSERVLVMYLGHEPANRLSVPNTVPLEITS